MSDVAREFREVVSSRNRGGGKRCRYGAELRSLAVGYANSERQSGRSWALISSELGVNVNLLQKWCREGSSDFARVEVEEEASRSGSSSGSLRVRTPSGYDIEGLCVAEAVQLLLGLHD